MSTRWMADFQGNAKTADPYQRPGREVRIAYAGAGPCRGVVAIASAAHKGAAVSKAVSEHTTVQPRSHRHIRPKSPAFPREGDVAGTPVVSGLGTSDHSLTRSDCSCPD
eukprot:CAMPEP_0170406704 /NCGR_PEP_ID=MMETSP0117_2-20130122/27861_1 /TAXON_ID=400756 /ORGANISM="Durinskia baltica, Strain CSIRO CS-38" /LENGTH=108 /DNA_ID=CAMNT_0010663913 /DNA_START=112 /DNA_END=436 /DNA_ORIENTATION=-